MPVLSEPRLYGYDVRLGQEAEGVRRAGERAATRPVPYERLGGRALADRGDMYSSLLKAASDATARRRLAEQQRMMADRARGFAIERAAEQQEIKNLANLFGGGVSLTQDALSQAAGRDPELAKRLRQAYSGRWVPAPESQATQAAGVRPTNRTTGGFSLDFDRPNLNDPSLY